MIQRKKSNHVRGESGEKISVEEREHQLCQMLQTFKKIKTELTAGFSNIVVTADFDKS